jgi:hypothetical protein
MRENRPYGSEGGEGKPFPTPINSESADPITFSGIAGVLNERRLDRLPRSGIELGVPIQIVEPAMVQIVRRKQPAIAVQVVHARLERHL